MGSPGASQNANPIGSQTINYDSNYGVEEVANSALNGLANGGNISGLVFNNITSAMYAKVVITLHTISPSGMSPNIQIDNGTSYYELSVDTTTSAKRVEFLSIPTSFLTSFKIYNNTGVALASGGNACTVYPM